MYEGGAMMNLVGERFGRLQVIELVVAKPYTKRAYKCICDCGNTCIHNEISLKASRRAGRISSCGCYHTQFLTSGDSERCRDAGKHRKDAFVNGCNIQMTLRPGTIATNTSGHQGVSWSNSANRWHCYIGYQNYRATLGYFEFLEDAIRCRELAETAIKNNTFEDFYFDLRGFRLEDKNKKQFKIAKRGDADV